MRRAIPDEAIGRPMVHAGPSGRPSRVIRRAIRKAITGHQEGHQMASIWCILVHSIIAQDCGELPDSGKDG